MYVLREVSSVKTAFFKAGQNPVHWPVAREERVGDGATLAALATLLPVLPHPALNIPHYNLHLTKISLSPDSCTREES